jgi:hypothetical protein
MVAQLLVPLGYMLFFSVVLTRIKWLKQLGFAMWFVIGFFIAKCVAGFVYNWVALHYIPNRGDIWPFFDDSIIMYRQFLQAPSQFLHTWSQHFNYTDNNVLNANSGFIRSAFEIIKTIQLFFNFFTFGSLAGNTVLFNFLATLAIFYCWLFFKNHLGKQWWLAGIFMFCIPSCFYYTAGILKEGIVFSLLLCLLPLCCQLITHKIKWPAMIMLVLLFGFLCFIKIFIAGIWLYCVGIWWLLYHTKRYKWQLIVLVLLLSVIGFIYSGSLVPSVNLPNFLVARQYEFLKLPAASALPTTVLEPNFASIAAATPKAIFHAAFTPMPGMGGKPLYLIFSFEIIAFWLVMLYLYIKKQPNYTAHTKQLAAIFCLFAGINLLFIGLIVPNMGAITRYRSIFLPFLALAALIYTSYTPQPIKLLSKLTKKVI